MASAQPVEHGTDRVHASTLIDHMSALSQAKLTATRSLARFIVTEYIHSHPNRPLPTPQTSAKHGDLPPLPAEVDTVIEGLPKTTWLELTKILDVSTYRAHSQARRALIQCYKLPKLYEQASKGAIAADRLESAAFAVNGIEPDLTDRFDETVASTIDDAAANASAVPEAHFKDVVKTAATLLTTPQSSVDSAHRNRRVTIFHNGDGTSCFQAIGPTGVMTAFAKRTRAFALAIHKRSDATFANQLGPHRTLSDDRTLSQLMFDILMNQAPGMDVTVDGTIAIDFADIGTNSTTDTTSTNGADAAAAADGADFRNDSNASHLDAHDEGDVIRITMPTDSDWLRRQAAVTVTVPALTAFGDSDVPGMLDGQEPVPADAARFIAAHSPTLYRILTDPINGTVLPITAQNYAIPAAVRTTVLARWVRCTAPGCSRKAATCELDHVEPFNHADPASGGPTTVDNLHPLCKMHHQLKTQGRLRVRMTPDGMVEWTYPAAIATTVPPPGSEINVQQAEELSAAGTKATGTKATDTTPTTDPQPDADPPPPLSPHDSCSSPGTSTDPSTEPPPCTSPAASPHDADPPLPLNPLNSCSSPGTSMASRAEPACHPSDAASPQDADLPPRDSLTTPRPNDPPTPQSSDSAEIGSEDALPNTSPFEEQPPIEKTVNAPTVDRPSNLLKTECAVAQPVAPPSNEPSAKSPSEQPPPEEPVDSGTAAPPSDRPVAEESARLDHSGRAASSEVKMRGPGAELTDQIGASSSGAATAAGCENPSRDNLGTTPTDRAPLIESNSDDQPLSHVEPIAATVFDSIGPIGSDRVPKLTDGESRLRSKTDSDGPGIACGNNDADPSNFRTHAPSRQEASTTSGTDTYRLGDAMGRVGARLRPAVRRLIAQLREEGLIPPQADYASAGNADTLGNVAEAAREAWKSTPAGTTEADTTDWGSHGPPPF